MLALNSTIYLVLLGWFCLSHYFNLHFLSHFHLLSILLYHLFFHLISWSFTMTDANMLKLKNNIERIIGAISMGKELNPPTRLSWPCSVCNRNCLKMPFAVIIAKNGCMENVQISTVKSVSNNLMMTNWHTIKRL